MLIRALELRQAIYLVGYCCCCSPLIEELFILRACQRAASCVCCGRPDPVLLWQMCHAQTLIISSTEGMPVFHIRFHCQVKTKLSSNSNTVNCILNMMVPRCLLSSEIRLTLNRLQAPGGRKFVMIIKLRGWCRGRRTFRAPSNTSCLTPAPESGQKHPTLRPNPSSILYPFPLSLQTECQGVGVKIFPTMVHH